MLDAQTGISGDMTVAALLDLGANFEKLQQVLATLPDQQFQIAVLHSFVFFGASSASSIISQRMWRS